ncbi:hypothetical protein P153DRAFT_166104 [Dothidotthia symphoricarpi CBS 119687]|uniref:Uncharacterized protein n=1 Tax=Dothidotthia symphoricarpi CBS 119687 TaxID=1392245 RepID=A0A6A6AMV8_9PLEO|nr:uncharacterized protein P153DRAFT_166104 [Dothidotthia symphoricarpi CBS 119687]KAF2132513.1 hypothetical protein P153DRAFT_166104 [Dothidotthia symphoricarpi CBS 119687]
MRSHTFETLVVTTQMVYTSCILYVSTEYEGSDVGIFTCRTGNDPSAPPPTRIQFPTNSRNSERLPTPTSLAATLTNNPGCFYKSWGTHGFLLVYPLPHIDNIDVGSFIFYAATHLSFLGVLLLMCFSGTSEQLVGE